MEIFDPKGEFNCVDLCHDAAKHAGMMALAAPSVVSRLIKENAIFFEFAARKFGR
jgi:hypothetical protein